MSNPTQWCLTSLYNCSRSLQSVYLRYTYNILRKYINADNIVMMASDRFRTVVEQTLSDDLEKLRNYFYNWRLKLNTIKNCLWCFSFDQLSCCLWIKYYNLGWEDSIWWNTKVSRCHSSPYTLLPKTLTKHRSKSKQRLKSTEKINQQPLGSRHHNFAYF